MEIFHLISFLFSLSHNNKYIKTIIKNFLFTPLIEIHSLTMEIRYRSVQKRPSRWYAADIIGSFKNMCAWLGTFKTTEEVDHVYERMSFPYAWASEEAARAHDQKATSHKHDQLVWWYWKFLTKHMFSWKGFWFQQRIDPIVASKCRNCAFHSSECRFHSV
jgi:hypothetical protein